MANNFRWMVQTQIVTYLGKIKEDQPIHKRNARVPKQRAEGQGVEKDPVAALLGCESAKFCLRGGGILQVSESGILEASHRREGN